MSAVVLISNDSLELELLVLSLLSEKGAVMSDVVFIFVSILKHSGSKKKDDEIQLISARKCYGFKNKHSKLHSVIKHLF